MLSVLFRVDVSQQIGAGHFMRCLALADHLQANGGSATFISRPLPHSCRMLLVEKKHRILEIADNSNTNFWPVCAVSSLGYAEWLPWSEHEDAQKCILLVDDNRFDWLVVDHYALAKSWEADMRKIARCVMVIDDLADRNHDCDLLLDQNFGRIAGDYDHRVGASTHLLIGPLHALLRPEFAEQRAVRLSRHSVAATPKLLITLGAVDKNNQTEKVLHALKKETLPHDTKVVVTLGAEAPHIKAVQAAAANCPCNTEVLINVLDMARLMSEATWAIGAAGISTWERCCLGLPTLTLVIAPNQAPAAQALSAAGYVLLADPLLPFEFSIQSGIHKLIGHAQQLAFRSAKLTDGRGVERVLRAMKDLAA